MHISYNYEDLINEIELDVKLGLLQHNGKVLILRQDEAIDNKGYRPIIDYYYIDYLTDNWKSDQFYDDEKEKVYKQYLKDKPKLEEANVEDVLKEMNDWNDIFR